MMSVIEIVRQLNNAEERTPNPYLALALLVSSVLPGLGILDQTCMLGTDFSKHHTYIQVEAYASRIGVSLKDPAIADLAGKLGQAPELLNKERDKLLLEIDDLMKKFNAVADVSPEKIELAKTITTKHMEVNAMTSEAYIGPNAGRMTVPPRPICAR